MQKQFVKANFIGIDGACGTVFFNALIQYGGLSTLQLCT